MVGEARDAAKQPTVHRGHPVQNVNSAKVEKSCSRPVWNNSFIMVVYAPHILFSVSGKAKFPWDPTMCRALCQAHPSPSCIFGCPPPFSQSNAQPQILSNLMSMKLWLSLSSRCCSQWPWSQTCHVSEQRPVLINNSKYSNNSLKIKEWALGTSIFACS